ncbi:MAG TPA: hypothetical protein VGB78_06610 [Thermoplasmata archaeon]|jgi:hypothetical protein
MGSESAVNPDLIKKRMRLAYQYACSNPANERMDCVHNLITKLADFDIDMHKYLQEAADTICEKLSIQEITIGFRSPSDGLYRYEVMSGLTEAEWEAHKPLSYKLEDFFSSPIYKYMQISRFTRLLLAEDYPYASGEEATIEMDVMLQSKRKSLEDAIEGDYLDILIYGEGDDLLGWIEISGMKSGLFPDVETIKCLELLASVIGVALTQHGASATQPKPADTPT